MRSLTGLILCAVLGTSLAGCCNTRVNSAEEIDPERDLCDRRGANCPAGMICCPSEGAAQCMEAEACLEGIPDPQDEDFWTPDLSGSCLEETLRCPGEDLRLDSCVRWDALGHTQATYDTGAVGEYYLSFGSESSSVALGEVCYETTQRSDGVIEIRNAVDARLFEVSVGDGLATVVCPDDSLEVLPARDLNAYLLVRPSDDACTRSADELVGAATCGNDSDCEAGASCCLSRSQVCDVALCGTSRCCDAGMVHACSAPDACRDAGAAR